MLPSTTISFETAVNKTELSQADNFLATSAASTSVEHSETEEFLATTSTSTFVEPVETGNFLSTISTSTSASTLIEQIPSRVRSFTAKPPSSNIKGTNVEEEIALSSFYASGFQSENGIGVFPKWSRTFTEFSEFRETDKSLKHELGSV